MLCHRWPFASCCGRSLHRSASAAYCSPEHPAVVARFFFFHSPRSRRVLPNPHPLGRCLRGFPHNHGKFSKQRGCSAQAFDGLDDLEEQNLCFCLWLYQRNYVRASHTGRGGRAAHRDRNGSEGEMCKEAGDSLTALLFHALGSSFDTSTSR